MLKFYYNLDIEEIKNDSYCYEFTKDGMQFILSPIIRSKDEIKSIYQICEELKKKNYLIHTFILNRENQIITQIYNQDYVLLKIEGNDEVEFNVIDMLNFTELLILSSEKSKLYQNNWGELWSKKIDYFEYQVRELGQDKKVVLNSFSYYIGLAENAIAYVNNTIKKYPKTNLEKVTLCHKRLKFPNLKKDYYNPLLFLFDLEIRDIAEYIKSSFFKSEKDAWIELKSFLNLRKLSIYGYQMFFARLLYPSYYFDEYEKIMNHKEPEENLIKYIEQANQYEIFLKKVYHELSKYIMIEKINWIIEKKEL